MKKLIVAAVMTWGSASIALAGSNETTKKIVEKTDEKAVQTMEETIQEAPTAAGNTEAIGQLKAEAAHSAEMKKTDGQTKQHQSGTKSIPGS